MTLVPVDAKRQDWPRLVAQAINRLLNRVSTLETHAVTTITFTPTTEPASPVEGMTYYDSGTQKLRTYDGTIWNDHW